MSTDSGSSRTPTTTTIHSPSDQQQSFESNPPTTTTTNASSDDKQQQQSPTLPKAHPTTAAPPSTSSTTTTTSAASATVALAPTTATVAKKITILLKAAGNAPILKMKNWEMEESKTVAYLVLCLRKILHLTVDQSLFVFVHQSFSPTPEHTIGTLHQCFGGGGGKLTIHYSTTLAWG